ncbi:MAG: hypothetical protein ACYCSR_14550, partial [Thiomonas sp.]
GFEQGWISLFQVLGSHPDGVVEARQEPATTLRAAQSEYPFNRGYMVGNPKAGERPLPSNAECAAFA